MLRPTKVLRAASPSSKAWLARQSRDHYVKQRLSMYRSRAAFKLLEIDENNGNFLVKPDVQAVVDLGAAPGGWSEVVASKLGWGSGDPQSEVTKVTFGYGKRGDELREKYGTWSTPKLNKVKGEKKQKKKYAQLDAESTEVVEEEKPFDPLNIDNNEFEAKIDGRGTIIAVDLLQMYPIHGVLDLQADFLDPKTEELIHDLLRIKGNRSGKADIILSDMAANSTGNQLHDIESCFEICEMVFDFATRHLRTAEEIGRSKGGVLLMKYFTHPHLEILQKEKLAPHFQHIQIVKPASSRRDSREAYFLCQGWKGVF